MNETSNTVNNEKVVTEESNEISLKTITTNYLTNSNE